MTVTCLSFFDVFSRPSRLAALLLAALLLAAWPGGPGQAQSAEPVSRTVLGEVESYLNGIETLRSSFIQQNADGTVLDGFVTMDRPGHMRLVYGDGEEVEIIADGRFLIVVDHKLENATYLPLSTTSADLLLSTDIRIGEDVEVIEATRSQGFLFITFIRPDEPDLGTVTLVLSEAPLQLQQWMVQDIQGNRTHVRLMQPRFDVEVDPALFDFVNPYQNRRQDQ